MSEKTYLTGKCPKCNEELRVPEGLTEFSCMFCGQRLQLQDLVTEAAPAVTENDLAAYEAALPKLAGCVLNYIGYQKKITKEEFFLAFEAYEADCAPVFRELDRGIRAHGPIAKVAAKKAALRLIDDLEVSWKARTSKQGDDKIVIAIFLVPMVRKQELSCSEAFCVALQEEWLARYPKNPFYLGSYEAIAEGFRNKKFLGLCFITTAVCESAGLPDDCDQLTAFRAFRDGYLRSCGDGPALIEEYYNIAPGIVMCIDVCEDRTAAYDAIRRDYLDACYADIQAGRNEDCKARYTKMVRDLQAKYLS